MNVFNFSGEIFHGLAEGVSHKVLQPILKFCYKSQGELDIILAKLRKFEKMRYGTIEGISAKTHKVHGTEMKILDFLIFPVLDDRIGRQSDHFKLVILLKEIICFVF